jgi:hypothetical protein
MKKEELIKIISDEYDKYCDNILIYPKLIQYIEQIPNYFENINNTLLEREKRRNRLEKDSDSFIQRFLNKHKYYYNTSSELFFEYNENKYTTIKEDDIQHKILSTISENKELTDWKHKIKVTILKQIKERDIFSCIPESKTIYINELNNKNSLQPRRRIHKIMKGYNYTKNYNKALLHKEAVKLYIKSHPEVITLHRIKLAKKISKGCKISFNDARYIITHLKRIKFFSTIENTKSKKITDYFY